MLKRLFAPGNDSFLTSLSLFVLRVWLGANMLINHGWGKLTKFNDLASGFPDPLKVGHTASLALVVFAEALCSALLILGLFTRFAALVLAVNVGVAFFIVHKATLKGEHSGELAFIYLAGYVVLFLAGAGKLSLDNKLFGAKSGAGKTKPKE